jgi:hypothetical protein
MMAFASVKTKAGMLHRACARAFSTRAAPSSSSPGYEFTVWQEFAYDTPAVAAESSSRSQKQVVVTKESVQKWDKLASLTQDPAIYQISNELKKEKKNDGRSSSPASPPPQVLNRLAAFDPGFDHFQAMKYHNQR